MNAIYTQLVRRGRLVVVELVDAYRREHRVEDRELARGEAADQGPLAARTQAGVVKVCFLHSAYRAADAAREKPLQVVVRRVEGIVINRAFDGHGLSLV